MKRQMYTYAIAVLIVPVVLGCYTQFVTLEMQGDVNLDTTEVVPDTIRTLTEREVCYWQRNFFGEWELHCFKTNYSDYWHSYYNRPWWYHQSFVDPHSRYHCPYHRSFHRNCELCWQYCYRNSYLMHHHKYKKGIIKKKTIKKDTSEIKSTSDILNPGTTKPAVQGPGQKGSRIKQGKYIVGKKPFTESTAHIPPIPGNLKKTKLNGTGEDTVLGTLPIDSKGEKKESVVLDSTESDKVSEEQIIRKTSPRSRRYKRK